MNQFIETIAPFAIKHGLAREILPSLIIAQGILETGGGTSVLAKQANNLFGIKKGMNWDGAVHEVVTGEYRKNAEGEDEYYEIVAEFRKYESYEGAVVDLCAKYNDMPRYSAVPGNYDFYAVTQAVKDAGYATDPNYPSKLQNIYETYDLGRFDVAVGANETNKEETEMKVVIDAGHFPNTPGKRSPVGEREWYFNNTVANALIRELRNYKGVSILRVDSSSYDVPLSARASKANSWGASIYVSIHHNANTGRWGTWTGVETYVYSATRPTDGSMKLAKEVHPRLVKAMGLRDRGIKKADFAVLRETRMPAILTEGGYMDSSIDIVRLRNKAVLENAGKEIAEGIAAYGGLKRETSAPTPIVKPKNLYRVRKTWGDASSQKGAFEEIDGAIELAKKEGLNVYDSKGKQVYPTQAPAKPATDKLYRVRTSWTNVESQKGAFEELEGAKELADRYPTHNVYDGDGKLVYDAGKAKAEAESRAKAEAEKKAAEKAAKEFEEAVKALRDEVANAPIAMIDVAIVMNSARDYEAARTIHVATGYPMFEREGLHKRKVARNIIGVGGTNEGLKDHGDKVTMVSGKTATATKAAVEAFIKAFSE